ncbi:MAG: RNA polymerase sigma factor [Candidatus Omnitrophica bacterium]|nr:RNA polymerase sigma factor [Candidatus Omnitrophota bacterium]MBU4472709.1 RNA polymerase sigma factor [Candidatus Omnitrophota bacterium]MCG2705991.1 RNA polymerase sigma factor [Candidatus Omnitrophota bacterium]
MTDLEFVQRCVKADKPAWDEFVDRYSRLIYNYIHSVLRTKSSALRGENINDIFQEIFLSLTKDNFKKLRSFKARNGCSLASWLRQVAINATIDYTRKLKPLVSLEEEMDDDFTLKDILADNSAGAGEIFTQKEMLAHLKDCIDRLDNDGKYFLELYVNRGLALEELKDLLRISRGAIDMRKSRIIERLKECFQDKGFKLDY